MRFALIAGVLSGCVAGLLAENLPAQNLTVTLLIQSAEDIAPATLQMMSLEVTQIFEPYGIAVNLFKYRSGASTPVMERAIVVKFCGECGPTSRGMGDLTHSGTTMAFTHSVDGQLLPFVEVLCDRVKAVLLERHFGAAQVPMAWVGRAFARVIAHEMYHVLTNTKRHTDEGLMRPNLSARDLTGQRLTFDRRAGEKLTTTLFSRNKGVTTAATAPVHGF